MNEIVTTRRSTGDTVEKMSMEGRNDPRGRRWSRIMNTATTRIEQGIGRREAETARVTCRNETVEPPGRDGALDKRAAEMRRMVIGEMSRQREIRRG